MAQGQTPKWVTEKYINKKRILAVCPDADDTPGIYIMTREENGFKYAYIGQAEKLLTRLADHLKGYQQHIDLSIKKHGLLNPKEPERNPNGWGITLVRCPVDRLDELEKRYIKTFADNGYQLRNKTAGGQHEGKFKIGETKPPKGYRDGLAQGYKKAQREVAHLFQKHLKFETKDNPPKRYQEQAFDKFKEFLEV